MADKTRLPEPQRRALDRLSAIPLVGGFYLAGGTAIAMHLGHRASLDLEFFSLTPDVDLDAARSGVRGVFDEAETVRQMDAAVQLLCDGTRIDLVRYPYPLLERPGREASEAYLRRFGVAEADLYHVFRALTYFEDAERDPVFPEGLTLHAWQDLEAFFRREVPPLMQTDSGV